MNKNEILKLNEDKRTKCVIYTRVMGYIRPIESFNKGKIAEHKERNFFKERNLDNEKTHL